MANPYTAPAPTEEGLLSSAQAARDLAQLNLSRSGQKKWLSVPVGHLPPAQRLYNTLRNMMKIHSAEIEFDLS